MFPFEVDDRAPSNLTQNAFQWSSKTLEFPAVNAINLCLVSSLIILSGLYAGLAPSHPNNGLPIVNKKHRLEPKIFQRLRWAFNARDILTAAHKKYGGTAFNLARGDTDVVVLPHDSLPELNRLPLEAISSRRSHAFSLTGNLNGIDIVLETDHISKILLGQITPALPRILEPAQERIQDLMGKIFPQEAGAWTDIALADKFVLCISRGVTIAVFGTPGCDNWDVIETFKDVTTCIFAVTFVMRLVPHFLAPALVWLNPAKWRLIRCQRRMEQLVTPEVQDRIAKLDGPPDQDVITGLVRDEAEPEKIDPRFVSRMIGALAAGATHSSAALILGLLVDLVAYPEQLEEIRAEIRAKHAEIRGKWDIQAYHSLDKLDSAMKETARLSPSTVLTYNRKMLKDYTLASGVKLKKGQFICTNGYCRTTDEDLFPDPMRYNPLRAYSKDLLDHQNRPFHSEIADDFRWGSGRWACPGRHVGALMIKIILVKLLDEYDFRFKNGKRPGRVVMHEFLYFDPDMKLQMRRREHNSGIIYGQ